MEALKVNQEIVSTEDKLRVAFLVIVTFGAAVLTLMDYLIL